MIIDNQEDVWQDLTLPEDPTLLSLLPKKKKHQKKQEHQQKKEDRKQTRKEKDRLRKRQDRLKQRGNEKNMPCDACGSQETQHRHHLEKFSEEEIAELSKYSGKDLTKRSVLCCKHFEEHHFERQSKTQKLVIKKAFHTNYYNEPSKRRKIKYQEPPPPRKRALSKSELERRNDKLNQQVNELESQVSALQNELQILSNHNAHLKERMNQIQQPRIGFLEVISGIGLSRVHL